MALVWADPFDQYGTATGANAFMLNAGYSSVNVTSFVAGRTGPYSINMNNTLIRRPLDTPATTIIQGAALNLTSCSAVTINAQGLQVWSAGPTAECKMCVQPDNSLGVYDRTLTLKGSTAPNVLIPGSFQFIEFKVIGNVGGVVNTGSAEVRVNGIVKLTINGLNLPNIFTYHSLGGSASAQAVWDDYYVCDNNGPYNNDYIGDRRLFLSYTNANGALQDFTANPAPAWDDLNNSPPTDATAYIEGLAAGNISEFTKTAIGIASNDIAAMVVLGRLFKSDAGTATGRIGINSNGNVLNSPVITPGTTGANYSFVIERDPNGNVPWTRVAADAANLRITRDS